VTKNSGSFTISNVQRLATASEVATHYQLQKQQVHRPNYVELSAALLDGTPDALRFRALAAALLAFLSAKKLVIWADKARARSMKALGAMSHPLCPSGRCP
jgi:hypothetical protein